MDNPKPIEFKHIYEITDHHNVSTYERSLIVNFYKLILTLQNQSCIIHVYKSEEKNVALKHLLTLFYNSSIYNLEQLYKKYICPTKFCEIVNNSVESLNNNLGVFAEHFLLKIYYQLRKIETKNDWISPRINSDWDIEFIFQKRYRN